MNIFPLITTIGGICGAVVTIMGCITLVMKKPKSWVKKIAHETVSEDLIEIKNLLKEIQEHLGLNNESMKCSLRHSITNIYEIYRKEKKIPCYVKKDLCSLYESYTSLGGNSYIHTIFDEMMSWETY